MTLLDFKINTVERFYKFSKVLEKEEMPGAKWFRGSTLNFAENLLQFRDNRIAIKGKTEDQEITETTYHELFCEVEKVSHSLRNLGIKKGDRVVGYVPNIIACI